jgi:type IV secretion system protein VirB9
MIKIKSDGARAGILGTMRPMNIRALRLRAEAEGYPQNSDCLVVSPDRSRASRRAWKFVSKQIAIGILALAAATLMVAEPPAAPTTPAVQQPMVEAKPVSGPPLSDAQRLSYHLGQTPMVPVAMKWKTIFVLPSSEKILDVICGFKDDWDVYAPRDSNFAMVTPLKVSARTDLAFVTKAGNIYTFEIREISEEIGARAYTQVLIEAADDKMRAALNEAPKYYGADEVSAFRAQAQKAEQQSKEMSATVAKQAEEAAAAARAEASLKIKHDYRFDKGEAGKSPWNITGIWHDDKFSYVEAKPSEQFAVYAVTEGKPTAINIFPTGDGSFRTDRILDAGYFKLGNKELKFARQ